MVKQIKENEVPVNNVGGEAIDGIGIGPKGEPPGVIEKKKKKKHLRKILTRYARE